MQLTGIKTCSSLSIVFVLIVFPSFVSQIIPKIFILLIMISGLQIWCNPIDSNEGTFDSRSCIHQLFPCRKIFLLTPSNWWSLILVVVFGGLNIALFLVWQISNMAEKVPSFKTGGAYWFLDLTTPDAMYVFPVLAAMTFLLTVEVSQLLFHIICSNFVAFF